MTGICCLQVLWARSASALTHQASHLQFMQAPQSTNALLVDTLLSIEQHTNPAIAIARMLLGQMLDLAHHRRIVGRVCDVAERRAMDLHQGTGALHRQSAVDQELHRLALLGHRQPFFWSSSLSRSFSSMRSASNRLRRAFSFSSSLRRWASLTDMLP